MARFGRIGAVVVAAATTLAWFGATASAAPNRGAGPPPNPEVFTFDHTGAAQDFPVPDGVTRLDINACGAQSGGGQTPVGNRGRALGGRATVTNLPVTPTETLEVNVGGGGGEAFVDTPGVGGFNGGSSGGTGSGSNSGGTGGGGGGASDIRQGGNALGNRVIVAGGAGGGGGGNGDMALGGTQGANGSTDPNVGGGGGGGGGTGSGVGGAGAAQGTGGGGSAGTNDTGGSGGTGVTPDGGAGAGGGGGLFGGGGGGGSSVGAGGGGGGGSGLVPVGGTLTGSQDCGTTAPAGFAKPGRISITITRSAPDAPTNVVAALGSVIVSWDAPGFLGNSPITDYVVTADDAGATTFNTGNGNDTSLEIDTLPPGTYKFTVEAVNAFGTSTPSAESNEITISPPTTTTTTSPPVCPAHEASLGDVLLGAEGLVAAIPVGIYALWRRRRSAELQHRSGQRRVSPLLLLMLAGSAVAVLAACQPFKPPTC